MAVPLRSLNEIEHEIAWKLGEALAVGDTTPMPFIEDGELAVDYTEHFGRPLTLSEILVVKDLIADEIAAPFRMPLIIARELGPTRRDGGPTIAEYRDGGAAHNVEPLLQRRKKMRHGHPERDR